MKASLFSPLAQIEKLIVKLVTDADTISCVILIVTTCSLCS